MADKVIDKKITGFFIKRPPEVLREKQQEYEQRNNIQGEAGEFPPTAELCLKCHTKAVIVMDGCKTCLNCGASKCQ